jgi:hypothetical protein
MGREWMRRGRKNCCGGRTTDCSTRKGEKVKGGKNRDKKIVMVKLIIQPLSPENRYNNNKKSS